MTKKLFTLFTLLMLCVTTTTFTACGDDDEDNATSREHDGTLYGEWVENGSNKYVFDYYQFHSDGTGIHGSWESDIDWVNEVDDITWYTVDKKYLYINGAKYEYTCDGTSLVTKKDGKTRYYREK